jgi:hypothetical protein
MLQRLLGIAIVVGSLTTGELLANANAADSLSSRVGGKWHDLSLSSEDLLKSPAWKRDAPNPPVSAAQAIRAASDALKTVIKGMPQLSDRKWKLGSVNLCSVGFRSERWIWTVEFEPGAEGEKLDANSEDRLLVVVLMSGRVLTPLVRPAKQ